MSDHTQDEVGSPPADPFEGGATRKAKRKQSLPFWLELPLLILVALVIAVIIKTFLVQAFWIPSSSMEETLQVNDRVLVNKLAYRIGDLDRGHIVVFDDPRGVPVRSEGVLGAVTRNVAEAIGLSTPRSEFIKRVIGLPGETIEVRDNQVIVNGQRLLEPYVKPGSRMPDFGPVTVPSGEVFVMGDNRSASQDSRFFGTIPTDEIVGRAFIIIWPPSRWGGL